MVVPTLYFSEYVVHRPWLEGLWVNGLSMSRLNELVVRPH
jgi:hypothetical protein